MTSKFFQQWLNNPLLANPSAMLLMGMVPVLWIVGFFSRRQRYRALSRLGSRSALLALTTVRRFRRFLRTMCFYLGMSCLIIGIGGPQWGIDEERGQASGRDIVVVVDLSRSMLAEDVLPNRLGRARRALFELANAVENSGGHRIALVVFAARPRVLCPLTPDYDHFREAIDSLDVDDPLLAPAPEEERPASATRIGAALRAAVGMHDTRFRDHQEILLLSDGDDPATDFEYRKGIQAARERGIPIHTFGIGDPDRESTIPDKTGRPILHDGKPIATKLYEEPLKEIAKQTKGVYESARTLIVPMDGFFRHHIQPKPGREAWEEADQLPTYQQRYPYFIGPALAFFALATLISDRPKPKSDKKKKKKSGAKPKLAAGFGRRTSRETVATK